MISLNWITTTFITNAANSLSPELIVLHIAAWSINRQSTMDFPFWNSNWCLHFSYLSDHFVSRQSSNCKYMLANMLTRVIRLWVFAMSGSQGDSKIQYCIQRISLYMVEQYQHYRMADTCTWASCTVFEDGELRFIFFRRFFSSSLFCHESSSLHIKSGCLSLYSYQIWTHFVFKLFYFCKTT